MRDCIIQIYTLYTCPYEETFVIFWGHIAIGGMDNDVHLSFQYVCSTKIAVINEGMLITLITNMTTFKIMVNRDLKTY